MWILRLALTFLAAFYFVLTVSSGQFTQIRDCTCEGYEQMYECTVNGSGPIIWKGSVFDCSSRSNEIVLSHLFTSGSCNNGAIVGGLVEVENDTNENYTSQLTVSVSSDMIGRNISCCHEIGSTVKLIEILLMTTTTVPYPPPNDVQLLDASSTHLTFHWTSVSSICPAISYQIVADNCGDCPNVTNDTTVTCDWSFTEENVCTFAVQTVVCDDIVGNQSQEVSFTLKVPDAPAVIDIVPTYSHEMSKLLAINTTFSKTETFNISENIDGSALYYTINYTDTDSSIVCNSTTVWASNCLNGQCVVNFQMAQATHSCSKPLSHIGVTVSAANRLGMGPSSIANTTNKFVSINYEMASNTIICVFDGDHVHLGRLKSCSILYAIQSTEGPYCNFSTLSPLWTNSNTSNSSNQVYITIADGIQSQQSPPQEYCFTATAKYGKQTVIINGSFVTVVDEIGTGTQSLTQTLAIVITVGTFSIALCLLGLLIIVICFNVKRKLSVSKPKPQLTNSGPNREQMRSVSATSAMTEESQLESDQELEPMHIYNILEPPEEQSVESPAQYAEITNRVYVEIEKTSAQGNRPVPPQYDDIVQYTEVSKVPQNKSRTRKTGVDTFPENGTNGMIFQLNHKQVRQNQQDPCLDTQPSMFVYDSQNTQFDQKTTSPLSILNDSFDFTQPPPLPPKNEQSP